MCYSITIKEGVMEIFIVLCYDYLNGRKYEFPVFAQSPFDAYEFFLRVTYPKWTNLEIYNILSFPARAW